MIYSEFEKIMTKARMSRYLIATDFNSRKAMTLYRKNLQLTQEMYTVLSCFEIALRNSIDSKLTAYLGPNWLISSTFKGGIFDNLKCKLTHKILNETIKKLPSRNHNKLIAELGFGFWRFMFAQNQFNATGRILIKIFPSKPKSSPTTQYNNIYIFNQLAVLNELRNRMAHHEPICFVPGKPIKNTQYIRENYQLILQFFQWMQINETSLLYGLNHIDSICDEIDHL